MHRPYDVTAAPIARIVKEEIAKRKLDHRSMATLIYPDCNLEAAENRLSRLLTGNVEKIDFDSADEILCRLDRVMEWWSPELVDEYQTVNLVALDVMRPTTEEVGRQMGNYLLHLTKVLGTKREVYAALGINQHSYATCAARAA